MTSMYRPLQRACRAVLHALRTLFVASSLTGMACAAAQVDARLTVVRVDASGRIDAAGSAAAAKPGDVLDYGARYHNRGTDVAQSLMPTLPIPEGTEYVIAGPAPRPTHASLDGIAYAPIPLKRRVVGTDGVARDVDVPLAEYRALRWSAGALAPGAEVTVHARVRVTSPSAPAP